MTEKHGNTKAGPAPLTPAEGLRVEGLSVSYPGPAGARQLALDGVSFQLAPGEALGIWGPSGSGKSTLALALAGLLPASARLDATRLELGGRSLLGLREQAWRGLRGAEIGCVFQQPFLALSPWRRVGEQLADVLRAHRPLSAREARARAGALLAELGLDAALAAAFPHQLSGGQRQRVVFCQAIAAGPRLLIADEPTAALDEEAAERLLEFLARLRARRSLSLLWISHDPQLLGRVADCWLVLENGRLLPPATATTWQEAGTAAAPQLAPVPPGAAVLVKAEGVGLELGRGRFWQRQKQRHQLLEGIHFELRAGEVCGLHGPSGSGKTTLLRCLAGLETPTAGRLSIAGEPLAAASAERRRQLRRQIQLVAQDPARVVDPRWPLWRVVSEGWALRPGGGDRPARLRAEADQALARLGLGSELLGRRSLEVSGGQLQRAVLARALLCGARALLLDEAFSALDLSRRRQLLELLLELRRQHGLALLFVSHQRSWLESFCQRTLEMRQGRLST